MTTERAVYLMVNAAWRQFGGKGKTAAVIIRNRQPRSKTNMTPEEKAEIKQIVLDTLAERDAKRADDFWRRVEASVKDATSFGFFATNAKRFNFDCMDEMEPPKDAENPSDDFEN
jgi:hypothetical protein